MASDKSKNGKNGKLYLGVDVGGTKMLAVLAQPSGKIVARERTETPRGGTGEDTLAALIELMDQLTADEHAHRDLRAIGLAVPGVIDEEEGAILASPNMNTAGLRVAEPIEDRFGVPVSLGNDVNMGALGEKWVGAASDASTVIGMFIGTGIGGGIIIDNQLLSGVTGAAGEVGHMVMLPDGPLCGCGARGCLEALASRTAMERDIRAGISAGQKSALTDLTDDLNVIKSGMLRKALQQDDQLVGKVLGDAAEWIGRACVNLRFVLDPDMIVLGGGLMEACDFYMMPIIEKAYRSDAMTGGSGGRLVVSALGDDAVALGAVALAQQSIGKDPFESAVKLIATYPTIDSIKTGEVKVGGRNYKRDVFIRADGKVKNREKLLAKVDAPSPHEIGAPELRRVCKGGPAELIIGAGIEPLASLTEDGEQFLLRRAIDWRILPSAEAAEEFNKLKGRKAILMHVSG